MDNLKTDGYYIEKIRKDLEFIVEHMQNVDIEGQDALVETYTDRTVRKVVHPSYQAWSYTAMIYDYNQNVQIMSMTCSM